MPEEEVVVFDNTGTEYFCNIRKIDKEVILQIKKNVCLKKIDQSLI